MADSFLKTEFYFLDRLGIITLMILIFISCAVEPGIADPGPNNQDQSIAGDECENWQNLHPEWLFCDSFEKVQDITVNYHDYPDSSGHQGMGVTTDDAFRGQYSLKQHCEPGQVSAGYISWFFGDTLGRDYGPIRDEIYMRWYHKFEEGFQGYPDKMARITSIDPGWDKLFGVFYWIEDYELVADVSTPSGWLPIRYTGFSYDDPNNIGRWICHEMHVKANDPGRNNGAYTFWVDGRRVVEVSGVNLVGNNDKHFNNAMLDCYWNNGSPKAQNRYYDNFVISTKRIGCLP